VEYVILDDGSTDGTLELIREWYQDNGLERNVYIIRNPIGALLDEVRDKNKLYEAILVLEPTWVLAMDGDEEISSSGQREIIRLINKPLPVGINGYAFYFLFMWKMEHGKEYFSKGKKFWPNQHPRMYHFKSVPNWENYKFRSKHPGGFHCGSVPHTVKYQHAPVIIKHYGYVDKELRERKYNWYKDIDGTMSYEHLIEKNPQLIEWQDNMTAKGIGLVK